MDKLVSVVVVTCGKNDYFISCLQSVNRQTHPFLDIILIDNSFDPAVSRRAQELCPSLRVHASSTNLFYCGSMNQGIAMSRGEFVLCLNDDVVLDDHFIGEALGGFLFSGDIGMVSGKVLRQDKKTVDSTGLFLSVWRTAMERGYGRPDHGQFGQEEVVFGVGGAVAFYRKKMLDQVKEAAGWFDPDFRIFNEDLDLAWRANRNGWRAYYIPSALAYHARGGSVRVDPGSARSFARQYLSDDLHADLIKNRYLAIIKNETFFGFVLHFVPMLVHDLCAWGYVVVFRPRVIGIFLARCHYLLSALRRRGASGSRATPGQRNT